MQAIADSPPMCWLSETGIQLTAWRRRLQHARRLAVVGNGGIAMELAFSPSWSGGELLPYLADKQLHCHTFKGTLGCRASTPAAHPRNALHAESCSPFIVC